MLSAPKTKGARIFQRLKSVIFLECCLKKFFASSDEKLCQVVQLKEINKIT